MNFEKPLERQESVGPGGPATVLTPSSKHTLLRAYAAGYELRTFVETGTHEGDTLAAMLEGELVDKAYSFESEPHFFGRSQARFASYAKKPTIILGNSAELLPEVLRRLTLRTLFWLDAHAGWIDDPNPNCFPLRKELEAIKRFSPPVGSFVLIDDARFLGFGHWPSLAEIDEIMGCKSTLSDDVVRIAL